MTRLRARTGSIVVLAALLSGAPACDRASEPAGQAAASNSQAASPPSEMVSAPDGIRWQQFAGTGDVATSVKAAMDRAHAEGRTLLVYVGATWCEPCQRFHHAVDGGELDAAFPHLSILGFDADRDTASLGAAGYTSRLIPLFALPRGDGHASGKQIEGSVKGESAVSEITPRLRALLDGAI